MAPQRFKLNGFFVDPATGMPNPSSDTRWEMPTLTLLAASTVQMYKAGRSSIHKVELIDNSGLSGKLTSNLATTPVAKGLHRQIKVRAPSLPPTLCGVACPLFLGSPFPPPASTLTLSFPNHPSLDPPSGVFPLPPPHGPGGSLRGEGIDRPSSKGGGHCGAWG